MIFFFFMYCPLKKTDQGQAEASEGGQHNGAKQIKNEQYRDTRLVS
jgi:hypothetical protein